jgi:Putative motility protein
MNAMDVTSIASSNIALMQNQNMTAIQTKVLRNSMDTQAQVAQGVLQALPQNQTVLNPSGIGGNFDAKF